jgi:glucose-6-phosphate 1-dehydrogenase
VIFGITGDLAKVMTFRSLYRLEKRGLLKCPIVGVAGNDWTVEQLRSHARECIEGTGETVEDDVFDRFAARLSYVSGDFTDADTYTRLATAIGNTESPVFYLEIPPFLFGPVIKQLRDAGLTRAARIVVRPFGHDRIRPCAAAEIHQYIDEAQLYRIDHFLGKMGTDGYSTCDSPTRCSSRFGTATTSPASRSRWPRASAWPTGDTMTRSARSRRRRQSPHAGRRPRCDGAAGRR